MTCVHLIVVSGDLQSLLVAGSHRGDSLPIVPTANADSAPTAITEMLTSLVDTHEIVHWAPLPSGATSQERHAYCLATFSGHVNAAGARAIGIDHVLKAQRLPPPQDHALRIALGRQRKPMAAFDAIRQVRATVAWARREIAARADVDEADVEMYRCARHHRVARLTSPTRTFFLKAGRDCVSDEASLTGLLRGLSPQQLPATVSVDARNQRWLYEALPGELLVPPFLTPRNIACAVRSLAALQKQAMRCSDIRHHLAARSRTATELLADVHVVIRQTWEGVDAHVPTSHGMMRLWDKTRPVLAKRCVNLDALSLRSTLVLSDFWTHNILLTTAGVGFLDVGNSYWSLPFLPLRRFLRDAERRLKVSVRSLVEDAFVEEWADAVPAQIMRRGMLELSMVGSLFAILMAVCDLDSFEDELGEPLPLNVRRSALERRVRALAVLANGEVKCDPPANQPVVSL